MLIEYISNRFQVDAPLEAVSFFHHNTHALVKLTPPPVIVQFRNIEPLANGSISEFILWFGPLPLRWKAGHSQVDPQRGFCDTQLEGPMQSWVHTHHWERIDPGKTLMEEKIAYEYPAGIKGMLARLLFSPIMLRVMLVYRKWVIRRESKKIHQDQNQS